VVDSPKFEDKNVEIVVNHDYVIHFMSSFWASTSSDLTIYIQIITVRDITYICTYVHVPLHNVTMSNYILPYEKFSNQILSIIKMSNYNLAVGFSNKHCISTWILRPQPLNPLNPVPN
jgi:hypothetical protein